MKSVGVVAALPAELAPLVQGRSRGESPNRSQQRFQQQSQQQSQQQYPEQSGQQSGQWSLAWSRQGEVYVGTLLPGAGAPPVRAYAAAAGMGAAAASRAFALVAAAAQAAGNPLDSVVSYGWAGAISCGVRPPEVHVLAEVIESRTGERFATASPAPAEGAPLRLVTIDHIARPEEKRALAERHRAVLVDMEAGTVGRLARAHGLDFYCLKGISDGYTDALPDFNRFLGNDGQLRLGGFILHALVRPAQWPALVRLGRQSNAAAAALAEALPACLLRTTLVF